LPQSFPAAVGNARAIAIFAQPTNKKVWAQHERVADELERRFPAVADMLREAAGDVLAFTTFPQSVWR
jgi:putative transposase